MDYLNPNLPSQLRSVSIPVVDATPENFEQTGFGFIVNSLEERAIEIVRWPAQGWRPVDEDSGDEGGTTQGIFHSYWQGDILFGRNEAVSGHYILGYAKSPQHASEHSTETPQRILLWHANYHPDGAQLFFPTDQDDYLVPLALPGDDVQPEDFTCFRFRDGQGCYIHPNVWHEGVFAPAGKRSFHDIQGKVHARVSVDFAREFQCLLEIPLQN